jgi:hypothetical protein
MRRKLLNRGQMTESLHPDGVSICVMVDQKNPIDTRTDPIQW